MYLLILLLLCYVFFVIIWYVWGAFVGIDVVMCYSQESPTAGYSQAKAGARKKCYYTTVTTRVTMLHDTTADAH